MMDIPVAEYQKRAAFLKKAMSIHDLDALIIYSWKRGQVRYISGYHPNYIANVAFVILPLHTAPRMFIRFPFDLDRARHESWIENITANRHLTRLTSEVVKSILSLGLSPGKIGVVAGDEVMEEMPYSIYCELEKELPEVELVDASSLLSEARRHKSLIEFDLLRRSGALADECIFAASCHIKPGQKETELVAIAEATARRSGARSWLAAISSKDDLGVIGPPSHDTLQFGNSLLLEFAVETGGYWTQVVHTFHIGTPSIDQVNIYSAVFNAYQAGVAAAQPGNFCADIFTAIYKVLAEAGYADYLKVDFGHGIGLDLPEAPSIEKEDSSLIEPGMALVIHPSVQVPGKGRAFLGGTILIHDHGPEPIHVIPSSAQVGE